MKHQIGPSLVSGFCSYHVIFFLSYDLLYMMITETLTTSEQIPIPSFNNPLKHPSLHYHCQLKKQRQIATKAPLDTASDYIGKNQIRYTLCVYLKN